MNNNLRGIIISVMWMLISAFWISLDTVQYYRVVELKVFYLVMIIVWSVLFGIHLCNLIDFIVRYKRDKRHEREISIREPFD